MDLKEHKKILVLGDTHGHDSWKYIIEQEDINTIDKVIFLGDYLDSFTVQPEEMKNNYLEIQKFRNENVNKVITLIGNHDYHYVYNVKYSGWNHQTYKLMHDIIKEDIENKSLLYAYKIGDIIFSHAGITNYWLDNIAKCTLNELLNNEVNYSKFDIDFSYGYSPYGDTISNSPLWIRPNSLAKDAYKHYTQVVGHTNIKRIVNLPENTKLWFCDTLPNEYLVIENDEFIIKTFENEKDKKNSK